MWWGKFDSIYDKPLTSPITLAFMYPCCFARGFVPWSPELTVVGVLGPATFQDALDLGAMNGYAAPLELTPLRRLSTKQILFLWYSFCLEKQDGISYATQRNTGGKFHIFSPSRYNKLNELIRLKNIDKGYPMWFLQVPSVPHVNNKTEHYWVYIV